MPEYPTNVAGNLTFGNSVSNAPSRIGKEQRKDIVCQKQAEKQGEEDLSGLHGKFIPEF